MIIVGRNVRQREVEWHLCKHVIELSFCWKELKKGLNEVFSLWQLIKLYTNCINVWSSWFSLHRKLSMLLWDQFNFDHILVSILPSFCTYISSTKLIETPQPLGFFWKSHRIILIFSRVGKFELWNGEIGDGGKDIISMGNKICVYTKTYERKRERISIVETIKRHETNIVSVYREKKRRKPGHHWKKK